MVCSACSRSLGDNKIGKQGCIALGKGLEANGSLTSISLLGNKFDVDAASLLLKLKEEKPTLISLCGLKADQTEAKFAGWGLTAQDARLLAPEIAVSHSLSSINLKNSRIGSEGAKVLAPAIRDSHSLTQVLAFL